MNPRRLTPSMSLLIAFDATARHLSFTRAAAELALTQSAVSRQVQALEGLLGVPLFRRINRKLLPTAIGSAYHREISAALQRVRSASLHAIASATGRGTIDLAALPTFASKWLVPRLSDFYAKHSGILINLHSRIGQFDLTAEGMDAAIGVGVGVGAWPGLASYRLRDEMLLPIISPALAAATPVHKSADISRHLLLRVATRPDVWGRWFEAQGLDSEAMNLGPQFELTSHLIEAVSSGIGVGLVPGFLVQDELRSGAVRLAVERPLKTGLSYFLILPSQSAPLPQLLTFKNWILSMAMDGETPVED
ncbi:LysR substrate-binding domain-containing protein [Paraburkholderia sp. GAS348]|uniref:LysR substrate-binding domain-containing protein n=1 Tax=Paraburkholderia sp. GAS348 TaxID=3035132 RepID=UPI003D1EBCCF